MFKVGDFLVYKDSNKYKGYLFKVIDDEDAVAIAVEDGKECFVYFADMRLATKEEIAAGHRIDNQKCKHGYDVACLLCGFGTVDGNLIYHSWTKERPISRKRKRKLSKQGKTVYWSKRLEQYVYVMGE